MFPRWWVPHQTRFARRTDTGSKKQPTVWTAYKNRYGSRKDWTRTAIKNSTLFSKCDQPAKFLPSLWRARIYTACPSDIFDEHKRNAKCSSEMSSSLLVVHPCTLCGLRLRIICVIHSSDFAVLQHNYRGFSCNFSTFIGFAF